MLNHTVIGPVLDFLDHNFYKQDRKITKILDLGAGEGWLSYWLRIMLKDSLVSPQYIIDAIELYEPFIETLQTKAFYTNVYHENILSYYKELQKYDLVVGLEVLEHLPKPAALDILQYLIIHNKYVFFSTPDGFRDGGDYHNNPYQEHRCGFTKQDAKQLQLRHTVIRNQLYLYSKDLEFPKYTILIALRRKLLPARLRTKILSLWRRKNK